MSGVESVCECVWEVYAATGEYSFVGDDHQEQESTTYV